MPAKPLTIGLLPLMLGLYEKLVPDLREKLEKLSRQLAQQVGHDHLCVIVGPVVAHDDAVDRACRDFADSQVDLLVLVLYCYAASGQIVPAVARCRLPLLLWPVQTFSRLDPDRYDDAAILTSHGIHGVQDLANILRRCKCPFGVMHRQPAQPPAQLLLQQWAYAGRVCQAMKQSHPLVLGGAFPDMLDLQLDKERFLADLDVAGRPIPLDDYVTISRTIPADRIADTVSRYLYD